MYFLLDLVSTGNDNMFAVSSSNLLKDWFANNLKESIFIFLIGFFAGITTKTIINYIKNHKKRGE